MVCYAPTRGNGSSLTFFLFCCIAGLCTVSGMLQADDIDFDDEEALAEVAFNCASLAPSEFFTLPLATNETFASVNVRHTFRFYWNEAKNSLKATLP